MMAQRDAEDRAALFSAWPHALLCWNAQEAATLSKPPSAPFWASLLVGCALRSALTHACTGGLARACQAGRPGISSSPTKACGCYKASMPQGRAGMQQSSKLTGQPMAALGLLACTLDTSVSSSGVALNVWS